jgi:hypothetical protein
LGPFAHFLQQGNPPLEKQHEVRAFLGHFVPSLNQASEKVEKAPIIPKPMGFSKRKLPLFRKGAKGFPRENQRVDLSKRKFGRWTCPRENQRVDLSKGKSEGGPLQEEIRTVDLSKRKSKGGPFQGKIKGLSFPRGNSDGGPVQEKIKGWTFPRENQGAFPNLCRDAVNTHRSLAAIPQRIHQISSEL